MRAGALALRDVVVLSDTAFVDGGGAAVGLRSAIFLARSGLRVTVVSAVGPPMRELLEEPNLRVLCSDQRQLAKASPFVAVKQGLWNERASRTLDTALDGCDPKTTIVHVHGWTKGLSPSIFHTATRRGFEVIVTLHDFFAICPNGSLYLHNDERICNIEPMGLRCFATDCDSRHYAVKVFRLARQVVQERFGGMPGNVKRFISVSDFSRAIIAPLLPANARIYPVRNPVNSEPAPPADPERQARFIYLGRLSPEKGTTVLARAAKDAGVDVAFAGDGACAEEIVAANPRAQLLGWLEAPDAAREVRASRALVLPSLWYETYGLSVMEAAAAGVPAIVPDTSASRELVVDGVTGFWFEGGNVASLADKLRRLSAPGVAERLGAAAYKRYWADPPTMSKHVASLLDVYESVLDDAAA